MDRAEGEIFEEAALIVEQFFALAPLSHEEFNIVRRIANAIRDRARGRQPTIKT